jgi:hypothetical protein
MDARSASLAAFAPGAAAVLASPVARAWLSVAAAGSPPPRLSARQRRLAVCVAVDAAPAFLVPCLVLNSRFALCHAVGSPLPLPALAPAVPAAALDRAIVDLEGGVVVFARGAAGVGGSGGEVEELRALALGGVVTHPTITLVPSNVGGAMAEVVYKRDCPVCLPYGRPCGCARGSSLQSASLPMAGAAAGAADGDSAAPAWVRFAEWLHTEMHGPFFACVSAVGDGGERAELSPLRFDISVTIGDPRLPALLVATPPPPPVQQPGILLPRPPPPPPPPSPFPPPFGPGEGPGTGHFLYKML